MGSSWQRVARGGCGVKAPPLASRPGGCRNSLAGVVVCYWFIETTLGHGAGFISVCLETRWLGQKRGCYVLGWPCKYQSGLGKASSPYRPMWGIEREHTELSLVSHNCLTIIHNCSTSRFSVSSSKLLSRSFLTIPRFPHWHVRTVRARAQARAGARNRPVWKIWEQQVRGSWGIWAKCWKENIVHKQKNWNDFFFGFCGEEIFWEEN